MMAGGSQAAMALSTARRWVAAGGGPAALSRQQEPGRTSILAQEARRDSNAQPLTPVKVASLRAARIILQPRRLVRPVRHEGHPNHRDEHRSLAAVLQGLLYLVREIRLRKARRPISSCWKRCFITSKRSGALPSSQGGCPPVPAPARARSGIGPAARQPGIRAPRRSGAHSRAPRGACPLPAGRRARIWGFAQLVTNYASFHWAHMNAEENDVLPRARQHLSTADWVEIDAAFTDNDDPLLGADARAGFRQLFRRIVLLAPPPLGVGRPRGPRSRGSGRLAREPRSFPFHGTTSRST